MYKLYIVKCADNSLYTGITNDIGTRISKHNGEVPGGAKYTRARRPVQLVYSETCKNKSEALKREFVIKKLSRAKKLLLIQTVHNHLLYEKIKSYSFSETLKLEEQDRQFLALKNLWNTLEETQGEKSHKVSYFLGFILINSLLAYQLSGLGEDYWEEFSLYFGRLYTSSYELSEENINKDFLLFLQQSKNNKRLINMKEKRLKKVVKYIVAILGNEEKYYKNMNKLLEELSTNLGQKKEAKILTFAIKMFGYGARNIYPFHSYPKEIFIPIDSRLQQLFEKYKGRYEDIHIFYYDLSELLGIPMLHLDALVWNEASELLKQ